MDFFDQENQPQVPLVEQVATLERLGFHFTQEELDAYAGSVSADYTPRPYWTLLSMQGMGSFDWKGDGGWTPTSDKVYALDTEVFDIDNMYLNFMQGLLAISNGELPITGLKADNSQVVWEEPSGIMALEFDFDGQPHRLEMAFMGDWMDCSVLKKVNEVLKSHGVEKRFYAQWNDFQGFTVVYNTVKWAREFQLATGVALTTALG